MQLAFVLFKFFPYGGLQRDFLKILQACRQCGAGITVFTMQWEGPRLPGVTLEVFPGRGPFSTARRRQFVQHVLTCVAGGDFAAVLGFNRMPGLDFYYAADSCFAEKAYSQRGAWYRLAPRSRQYLSWENAVFGAHSRSRIFLISPLQREQFLRHYHTPQQRLIQLPPGINPDRRAGAEGARLRTAWRAEFGLDAQHKVVLQIGSGFAVKGVDRALRAIASLPARQRDQVRYFLVGQDRAAPYRQLARRLGLAHLVTILPGRDDVPRFLQGADLLLHPAYSESAGLVLLESIVAGLPVLTTDTCGYAFHVRQAQAGQVCGSPFDQQQLNRLLGEMLGDPVRLQQWKSNGIAYGRAEDLYHMAETVAQIVCDPTAIERTGTWA